MEDLWADLEQALASSTAAVGGGAMSTRRFLPSAVAAVLTLTAYSRSGSSFFGEDDARLLRLLLAGSTALAFVLAAVDAQRGAYGCGHV